MKREVFYIIQVLIFMKQQLQILFQVFFIRQNSKMIRFDTAALFWAEYPAQYSGKFFQKIVSFGISVPRVVKIHPKEVQENKYWISDFITDFFDILCSQFIEIVHIQEPGQIVILNRRIGDRLSGIHVQKTVFIDYFKRVFIIGDPAIGIPRVNDIGAVTAADCIKEGVYNAPF